MLRRGVCPPSLGGVLYPAPLRTHPGPAAGHGGDRPGPGLWPPHEPAGPGDVGSGKTTVAAWGAWLAAQSGWQSALMAPTEVLAEQHYRTMNQLLSPAGVRVALFTGSMTAAEKRAARAALRSGEVDLAVGTQALLSQGWTSPAWGWSSLTSSTGSAWPSGGPGRQSGTAVPSSPTCWSCPPPPSQGLWLSSSTVT